MSTPWTADIHIDLELATALVASQFPDLAGCSIRSFGAGWDNAAFLVDETWIFRFPRRQFAIQFMQTEVRILPQIAGRLPLPLPRPELVGRPTDTYPAPFAAYPLIAGVPMADVTMEDAERAALAPDLGRFLRALHALPPPEGTPRDTLRRTDVAYRVEQARSRLAELSAHPLLAETRAVVERAWAELPTDPDPETLRLVHGDLYAKHVLVDGSRVSGVIDWGDMHIGDPAHDLVLAWLVLPASAHAAFRAAYGGVGAAAWARARLRAAWDLAITLHYAVKSGDDELLPAVRFGLRSFAEETP